MKKEILALLTVAFVFTTLFAGCSKNPTSTTPSKSSAPTSVRQMKFVLAHNANEGGGYDRGAKKINELMSQYSDGKMTVEIHGNSSLGSEPETLESIRNGSLDMAIVSPANIAKYVSRLNIFTLPYLIKDYDHAKRVMNSDIADDLIKDARDHAGIVVMKPFLVDGFRIFFNSKKEIKTPSDLQGMKIRTPAWPVLIGTVKAFGANPVSMDWGEVYLALSSGTIDGAETLAPTLVANKMYDVAKYVSKDFHNYSPTCIIVNPKLYNGLSADEKAIFDKAVKEGVDYEVNWVIDNDASFYKDMQARGMTVTEVDLDVWTKAAAPVWEQFKGSVDQDLVKRIQAFREK